MSTKYEVVPCMIYRHVPTGRSFSIHGALPWRNDSEKMEYREEHTGFTVYNPFTNQYGVGRIPWKTREEAQAFADKYTPSRIGIGD